MLEQYGGTPLDAYRLQSEWITSLTNPVALLAGAVALWLLVRDGGAPQLTRPPPA